MVGSVGRGASGVISGLFFMSDLATLYRCFDSRHFQKQANIAAVSKQRPHVGHDFSVFTEMKSRRNGSPSRSEGAF